MTQRLMAGVLAGLLMASLGEGWALYRLHARMRVAEQAVLYVFSPTEVKDEKGRALRRADLVDIFLASALKEK